MLTARHDRTNMVLVEVVLADGAAAVWQCMATLEVDPGAFRDAAAASERLMATD
jgi:hypothetical protein